MRGHSHRQCGQRPEGRKVRGLQNGTFGPHDRQALMTVGHGAPMPGNVLEDRQHAPVIKPSATAPAIAATLSGVAP